MDLSGRSLIRWRERGGGSDCQQPLEVAGIHTVIACINGSTHQFNASLKSCIALLGFLKQQPPVLHLSVHLQILLQALEDEPVVLRQLCHLV